MRTQPRLALLGALVAAALCSPAAADFTFDGGTVYDTGHPAGPLAVGDLDLDGNLDLVTANFGAGGGMYVLFGNGDGTFSGGTSYVTGYNTQGLAIEDLNGDDFPEILHGTYTQGTLGVFVNNGDGTFATIVEYAAGTAAFSPVIADFNGDTVPDAVIGTSNSLRYFEGIGDGTFAAAVGTAYSGSESAVWAGDLNGDTFADIVAGSFDTHFSVVLGNGDGTFQTPVEVTCLQFGFSISVEDFDGDDVLDVVVAHSAGVNTLTFHKGNGDGTFEPYVATAAGGSIGGIHAGDFDLDGKLDLALARFVGVPVVFPGNGDGTFGSPTSLAGNFQHSGVVSADFDGDGDRDIAVSRTGEEDAVVFINQLDPEPGIGLSAGAIALGDVELGQVTTGAIIVENTGLLDLWTTPTLTNDAAGQISLDMIPASPQAPGTTETLSVSITPAGLGAIIGGVSLATNAATSPTVVLAITANVVDTLPPDTEATGPTGTVTQASPLLDIAWTGTDNGGTGITTVELFYQRDSGGYATLGTHATSPITVDTTMTGGNGTYDFYTVGIDAQSNAEPAPPTPDITIIFNDTTSVEDWLRVGQ